MIRYENYVKLPTIAAVQKFVSIAGDFEEDIRVKSEGYTVDAKSLIEMFVLDLSKEMRIEFKSENAEKYQQFIDRLKAADIEVIHRAA
jgi:phosphotransferase system HPr-like phosphotransfer protein